MKILNTQNHVTNKVENVGDPVNPQDGEVMKFRTTLPAGGTAGQVLSTNGSGVYSWTNKDTIRIERGTVATGSNGVATWTFPNGAFPATPIVVATAQDPNTGDTTGIAVNIDSKTTTSVTMRCWQGTGVLLGGNTWVASGSGININVVALAV